MMNDKCVYKKFGQSYNRYSEYGERNKKFV